MFERAIVFLSKVNCKIMKEVKIETTLEVYTDIHELPSNIQSLMNKLQWKLERMLMLHIQSLTLEQQYY